MTEAELIRGCQKGQASAQEVLYARYADAMFRVGFRYLASTAEAEDIVLIAFNKVFSSIGRFEQRHAGSLKGWIKQIVVNEALMRLRKQHNFHLHETLEEHDRQISLQDVSALEAEDIEKLVRSLPDGYRTVFNLYVVEGYSHEEISALLAISQSTSRTQLFKAKAHLRKLLAREGFHYGT